MKTTTSNVVHTRSSKMNASATVTNSKTSPKILNIALWVSQALLAAAMLMAGGMKIFTPLAELQKVQPWAAGDIGRFAVAIGTIEVLGALGLILPSVTRIMPELTPI